MSHNFHLPINILQKLGLENHESLMLYGELEQTANKASEASAKANKMENQIGNLADRIDSELGQQKKIDIFLQSVTTSSGKVQASVNENSATIANLTSVITQQQQQITDILEIVKELQEQSLTV
ncbi:MAG: hypothetical protein AAGJ90_19770 [Pseudomonadota bacterium]